MSKKPKKRAGPDPNGMQSSVSHIRSLTPQAVTICSTSCGTACMASFGSDANQIPFPTDLRDVQGA